MTRRSVSRASLTALDYIYGDGCARFPQIILPLFADAARPLDEASSAEVTCTAETVDTIPRYLHPRSARPPVMGARRARTLSRLFQATMGMIPEKRASRVMENATPVLLEKDLVFEPDLSSNEHERIWHYHTKLVFKDGEFLVRIYFVS